MKMNVSCGKSMWHDDKYLSVNTLSLHSPRNIQTLAQSKFPLTGLADWVLLDFSRTYRDVFTVMTSRPRGKYNMSHISMLTVLLEKPA